jgi:hypothetical protein
MSVLLPRLTKKLSPRARNHRKDWQLSFTICHHELELSKSLYGLAMQKKMRDAA